MAGADDFPKETRDDYSSKNTGRDCGVGFGCLCDDFAGQRPDRAGMQRQIPGGESRRHVGRPEVERLPQGAVRRRRCSRTGRCGSGCRAQGREEGEPPRRNPRKPRRLPHRQAPRSIRTPSIRNIPRRPPARRACTPAWTSTMPTRPRNANGGLKWIQKGGGYYSECTKKLKGAA